MKIEDRRKRIALAQQKLERSFLLVGSGAFQDLCESRSAVEIGFQPVASVGALALREVAGVLPRELTNRFRSKLINLPPLRHECYLEMLTKVASRMPPELARAFVRIGHATVSEAVSNQQGVRWLEEITLDAMIECGLHTQTKAPESAQELDCAA